MSSELHLFILWERVGAQRDAVLKRIGSAFDILSVFNVRWHPTLFSANLARFYGQRLPAGSTKELSCGCGPFTLVVVRDPNPRHAERDTLHGRARVNVNTYDLKALLRSPTGGNLPIHATDTEKETAHDLALLLGFSPEDFAADHPDTWDGSVVPLDRDLSGALGWASLAELFAVFDQTIDYLVLRNFEHLPAHPPDPNHGDIDLLVGDFTEACLVANASPASRSPHRVHMSVLVGGQAIPFDFRHVGDGYYDECWQRDMLARRERSPAGIFVPDAESHFYSLLYHAAVHKPAIAADYATRLKTLADQQGIDVPSAILQGVPAPTRAYLLNYLNAHGYRFTRPLDPTVYFNTAIARSRLERLMPSPRIRTATTISSEGLLPVHEVATSLEDDQGRANLLRPFTIHAGQRILELGCGTGALASYLGEQGAQVVAIEADPIRAALAETRCRNLPNVSVIAGEPATMVPNGPFDMIVIGDAPPCSNSKFDTLLALVATRLSPQGELLLAQDNPLGLKYFNGCPEERSGIPFFGINGLGAQASGRRELADRLSQAGFNDQEFFFPFPDHRQPGLILHASALADPELDVADLLLQHPGRARPETRHRAFAENLAWRPLLRNYLLPDLANAFLVRARLGNDMTSQSGWLAKMYSRGRRREAYRVASSIERNGAGRLVVRKSRLHPAITAPAEGWLRHLVADSDYLRGEVLLGRFHRAMALESGIALLADCLMPWFSYLTGRMSRSTTGVALLPGDCVDCIPSNILVTTSGEVRYFDAEWVSDAPIPLSWVLVRGIVYSLIECLDNTTVRSMTYREFVTAIAAHHGITLNADDFIAADRHEARLVEQSQADGATTPRLAEFLDQPLFLTVRLAHQAPDYRQSLAWHQAELARVKRTVSWRITAPLRVIWNLGLRLRHSRNSVR